MFPLWSSISLRMAIHLRICMSIHSIHSVDLCTYRGLRQRLTIRGVDFRYRAAQRRCRSALQIAFPERGAYALRLAVQSWDADSRLGARQRNVGRLDGCIVGGISVRMAEGGVGVWTQRLWKACVFLIGSTLFWFCRNLHVQVHLRLV